MGQLTPAHLAMIALSIATWLGAAWVVVLAVRRMRLFRRREK